MSRNSVVGIATGYGGEGPGGRSLSPRKVKNFLFFTSSRPALGPTQPIQRVPEVKRPGREADYSLTTSSEVNNTWLYTSTTPHAFMT
jgi:hypothetical protein